MAVERKLRIAALLPLAASAAILLLFLVGETVGGDWSGLGHLIQLLPMLVLMWLGWKRPRLAGWLLLALAVIASLSLYATPAGLEVAPLLILVAPLLLSAVLFLLGARSAKSEL